MFLNNFKPIRSLLLIVGLVYILHKSVFLIFDINDNYFQYSIETLFLIFTILSVIIVLVLLKVKEKSFDNVGMTFLLASSLKMIFCYLILRPILKQGIQSNAVEKINFFAIFILFLAIETVLTIRLVNEPQ